MCVYTILSLAIHRQFYKVQNLPVKAHAHVQFLENRCFGGNVHRQEKRECLHTVHFFAINFYLEIHHNVSVLRPSSDITLDQNTVFPNAGVLQVKAQCVKVQNQINKCTTIQEMTYWKYRNKGYQMQDENRKKWGRMSKVMLQKQSLLEWL